MNSMMAEVEMEEQLKRMKNKWNLERTVLDQHSICDWSKKSLLQMIDIMKVYYASLNQINKKHVTHHVFTSFESPAITQMLSGHAEWWKD